MTILFTVRGSRKALSGGRVNRAFELRKRGPKYTLGKAASYTAYIARVALASRDAGFRPRGDSIPGFQRGPVEVEIRIFWPAQHRQGAAKGLALLDVDSLAKATLDGLERAGVVHTDAQVSKLTISKHVDPQDPRIEITAKAAP